MSMDSMWVNIHDKDWKSKVISEYHKKYEDLHGYLDVFCDCLHGFHDECSHQFRDHIGEHEDIIDRFVHCASFKSWLQRAKKAIMPPLQKGRKPKIGCGCRSGRHRSVAGSRVLTHIVQKMGYSVADTPLHLARPFWRKSMCPGVCDECAQGTYTSEKKMQALNYAKLVWDTL